MSVEWNPEPQNQPPLNQPPLDQGPFWPGAAERRSPRWTAIVIAVAVVILIVGGVIWWFGRGSDDDGSAAGDADTTEEPSRAAEPTGAGSGGGDTSSSGDPSSFDDDAPLGEPATETLAPTTTAAPTTTVAPTTTTLTTVPPENPDQFGPATLSTNSTVSTVGLDSVHFGMTVAQAQQAAGTVLVPAGPTGPCYHVVPHNAPEGIVFLVHGGTVERVDINSGPITTRSGVGVGSPESMVTNLFGDSIERQVRIDGTVDLVFVPKDPGDRNYRVVFNITNGAVRALKAGRMPQVMLDTGCENP